MTTLSEFPENFEGELLQKVQQTINGRPIVKQLIAFPTYKDTADETVKIAAVDHGHKKIRFVLCAPASRNDLIFGNVSRSRLARKALGESLGQAVLKPLDYGMLDNYRYAIYPFCHPLSERRIISRIQNFYVLRTIDHWLLKAIEKTRKPCIDPVPFLRNLEFFLSIDEIPGSIRQYAENGLRTLNHNRWKPYWTIMHGDFWRGNILKAPKRNRLSHFVKASASFRIIDWAGAETKGFAFYDLIRLHQSLGSTKTHRKWSIQEHCRVLECSLQDVPSYLAAAFGWIGLHLKHFPRKRYLQSIQRMFTTVDSMIA